MCAVESATYNLAAMADWTTTRSGIQGALMQTQPASQAGFQDAMPPMTGNAQREELDRSLRRAARSIQAEEFRDDLAPGTILPPGEPHNNGLVRMITDGQYVELIQGMRDFVLDLQTQVSILQLLQRHFDIPNQPEQSAANVAEASGHNLHSSIAQAMRFHVGDMQLQLLGIEVMSHLRSDRPFTHTSVLYIVGALIPVLHSPPPQSSRTADWHAFTDVNVHVNCFRIIECVTMHGTTPWIAVDGHNIFTVITQSLQRHPREHMLALVCTQLLQRFVPFIRTQDDQAQMLICGTAGQEDVLCVALTLYLFDASVAMYWLAACHGLQRLSFVRMCQLPRLMDLAVNALNMHAAVGYVTPHAVAMICLIVKPIGIGRRAAPLTFACLGAPTFPILFGAMRVLQQHPHIVFAAKKTVCTQVYQILCWACENNRENADAVVRCGIAVFLAQAFQGQVRIERANSQWECYRDKLQRILFTVQTAAGAGAP